MVILIEVAHIVHELARIEVIPSIAVIPGRAEGVPRTLSRDAKRSSVARALTSESGVTAIVSKGMTGGHMTTNMNMRDMQTMEKRDLRSDESLKGMMRSIGR